MWTFVDGEFVLEADARVSAFDRGFLYGDGLFETIRITQGRRFLWPEHLERLAQGARFLRLREAWPAEKIEAAAETLLARNELRDGFLRINLSRGSGPRGYSPRGAETPSLVMTTHPASTSSPASLRVITSNVRVMADDPLARFKTVNRLPNILARMQADEAGADEALILNHRGAIAGAAAANVFAITGQILRTPPLSAGALAGTTRQFILAAARQLNLTTEETDLTPVDLLKSEGACLTSTGLLVTPISSVDGHPFPSHPRLETLRRHCEAACLARHV